jgi:hypothetical protein
MSDSVAAHSATIPGAGKYNNIDLDKIKDRTLKATIHKSGSPRSLGVVKTKDAGPTSYNTIQAIEKNKFSTTQFKFGRDKKVSYFDIHAKNNKSPGAGKYKNLDGAYAKISNSPMRSMNRRH